MYTTPLLKRFVVTIYVLQNVASLGKYMKIEARKNPLGWGCASRGASLGAVRARVFDDRFFKKGLLGYENGIAKNWWIRWGRKNCRAKPTARPFGKNCWPRAGYFGF